MSRVGPPFPDLGGKVEDGRDPLFETWEERDQVENLEGDPLFWRGKEGGEVRSLERVEQIYRTRA